MEGYIAVWLTHESIIEYAKGNPVVGLHKDTYPHSVQVLVPVARLDIDHAQEDRIYKKIYIKEGSNEIYQNGLHAL